MGRGRGLVKPLMNKVGAVQALPCPVTKKQVQAFLDMIGCYHWFVSLTKGKNSVMVKWNDKAEEASMELKTALCLYPVLVAPDFPKEFTVQTDASSGGLGAVLSKEVIGEEHLIS